MQNNSSENGSKSKVHFTNPMQPIQKNSTFGAAWWEESISRRSALQRTLSIGAILALAGISQGCDEEGEPDSLDLQRSEGWNFGATDKKLSFPNQVNEDSSASTEWKKFVSPAALLKVYEPKNTKWLPYFVPTLVQSLSSDSLRNEMALNFTLAMNTAYSRGLGMREMIKRSESPEKNIYVVDLSGAETVAFAAALADVVDVVPTFDNFPHPLGVVPSHKVLSAMLYYAAEIEKKKSSRPENAPALFLLDSDRLLPYIDDGNVFDNRYTAKVPTSANLKSLGISGILYLSPDESRNEELDDLNDEFASYKDENLSVAMLHLSDFKPLENEPATASLNGSTSKNQAVAENLPASLPNGAGAAAPVYYYGGGGSSFPWFFLWYSMMRPSPMFYPAWSPSYYAPMNSPRTLTRPNYQPVRRPTVFSSRSVGGKSGIGKTKPSGFGRVSQRSGNTRYSRAMSSSRRSGSWGRSGGWFSS
ncbi:MAG: hypothetical protein SFU91_08720 [Chloroherpetonaceae bacterium]|nr:hypothetical protein [Chloroherpetonaceae bacterium]